jgi:hypothetical protein
MLLNRSITTQFTVVFIVALLLVVGSFYLVLESVYHSQLKAQAETVADNVDAFGSWVSQYGRVWVRDNDKSYLGQVTLASLPADAASTTSVDGAAPPQHLPKNPALAQREFSVVASAFRRSRVTSHNFMNPVTPDAFEGALTVRSKHLEYYEMLPIRTVTRERSTSGVAFPATPARERARRQCATTERGFGFCEGKSRASQRAPADGCSVGGD